MLSSISLECVSAFCLEVVLQEKRTTARIKYLFITIKLSRKSTLKCKVNENFIRMIILMNNVSNFKKSFMKVPSLLLLFVFYSIGIFGQQSISSPDGSLMIKVSSSKPLQLSVTLNGRVMIENIVADIEFDGRSALPANKASFKKASVNKTVTVTPSFKHKLAADVYNLLSIKYNTQLTAEIKVFNDGFAYRFVSARDGAVEVNEQFDISFPEDYSLYASLIKGFESSYEEPYKALKLSQFPTGEISFMPMLFDNGLGNKIFLSDANVLDYPHLFVERASPTALKAVFPAYPLETVMVRDRASRIAKKAAYIAKTKGRRSFPWRAMIITKEDKQLLESDMIYLLADEGNRTAEWVRPGRVAWDWWNASNLYRVNFKAGLNTETWTYYMDFAARNGLEYLILDEGWSASTTDISKPNASLDLPALIKHGKEKKVDIILWTTWRALMADWTILDKYKAWGIAGVKVDFMDRADQWMVNFYEKAALETYNRGLLIDFHGAFKPTGLRRQFPNVIAYEGVCGLEQSKWSKKTNPLNNTLIPFIRMVAGPMDFTPGAMRNFHEREFSPNWDRPGSIGTRCHQVGMFILYETGIQMLADSPSNYDAEKETFDFLKQIPVGWDDTKVLDAKVGSYILLARKKGDDWYVGGMTGDSSHLANIDFSFLDDKSYTATIMQDGVNVEKFAEDFSISSKEINKSSRLSIPMYKGGGLGIILKKK
ncbi:MAG: glycoside hydrolase family 97 protein [Chitinophagaceae bacterium]|nr:MAG: glycoside hydrolase family 97 protein [Chitinophagaceae bacterium]